MRCGFGCQGDLRFAITGTYPAQDFFAINERDGRITVIKDLKEDVARAATYTVIATPLQAAYSKTLNWTTVFRVGGMMSRLTAQLGRELSR